MSDKIQAPYPAQSTLIATAICVTRCDINFQRCRQTVHTERHQKKIKRKLWIIALAFIYHYVQFEVSMRKRWSCRKRLLFFCKGTYTIVLLSDTRYDVTMWQCRSRSDCDTVNHLFCASGNSRQERASCVLAIDINNHSKMQDSNGWYSRQRSNAGRHPYPIQESASATSARPPDIVYGAQALSAIYRDPFTPATPTTHGELSDPCLSPIS